MIEYSSKTRAVITLKQNVSHPERANLNLHMLELYINILIIIDFDVILSEIQILSLEQVF